MNAGQPKSPLTIEPAAPGKVTINVDRAAAAPVLAFFADHIQMDVARDGVRTIFAKLHPSDPTAALGALEVSFPFRSFHSQLVPSVQLPRGDQPPFLWWARDQANKVRAPAFQVSEKGPRLDSVSALRANLALIAAHEDDAAIDLFHVDAQAWLQITQGSTPTDFRGQVRIIVSLALLVGWLERCVVLDEELVRLNPTIAIDMDKL